MFDALQLATAAPPKRSTTSASSAAPAGAFTVFCDNPEYVLLRVYAGRV